MGTCCVVSTNSYFSKKDREYYNTYLEQQQKQSSLKPKKKPIKCVNISSFIGSGNSNVFLEWDQNNNENLAVKKIKIGHGDQQSIKELANEVDLLKQFDHPNIVRYIDSKLDKNNFKIYMEFIDGGSLADKIKSNGPIYEEIAKSYLVQILKGLEYLHAKRIAHRDLKCANILVDLQGTIKLSDFGSARELTNFTKSKVGTPGFIAPEVNLLGIKRTSLQLLC